jgi:nitrite reductase/ring-hydroxylating ferredoxin subunit
MTATTDYVYATVDDIQQCVICGALSLTFLAHTGECVHPKCRAEAENQATT